jgi:hypothetical protein
MNIELEGFVNPDDYTFQVNGKEFDASDPTNSEIVGAVG